jgi:hypothetical protein
MQQSQLLLVTIQCGAAYALHAKDSSCCFAAGLGVACVQCSPLHAS